MPIVELDPQTDPRWQALVDRCESSAFHSPGWTRVLAETYGFPVRAYVELGENEEPKAGLLFARVKDMLGERMVSLPFSDYCDPIVGNNQEWASLSNRLLDEGRGLSMRCLHNDIPVSDNRFALVKRAKWHGLDLRPELEDLWGGLHESSRRAIRKAQREGISVTIAQDEAALRAFFEMHLRVRKYKYRLLSQPFAFFASIWRHLLGEGKGVLMLASHRSAVIGGVLFLEWKEKLYYKLNASVQAELHHRPNDLLIWEGIKYAKARSYSHLDFGLSDLDQESLLRFKRKYASEEKAITFLRAGPPPLEEEEAVRDTLRQLTGLLTDEVVPDEVTAKAGDILYRFFS